MVVMGRRRAFNEQKSVYLLLFTCLSGIYRQRFWIISFSSRNICQCGCGGRHTFDACFDVIAWSIRALISGEFPACDNLNIPFPTDSYRGKLAGVKFGFHAALIRKYADWAWFKQALALRGWQGQGSEGKCCWLCECGLRDRENMRTTFRCTVRGADR